MDSPSLEDQTYFGVGYEQSVAFRKLHCSGTSINCQRIIPLIDSFSPLATTFEAPILAGETLYPSVEYHIAAQLLRDVQKLDAVRHVPMQLSRSQLRYYLNQCLIGVPVMEIENWRRNRMYSALKAATELKFAQYPELKALLIQTDDAFLFEVLDKSEPAQASNDSDWSVGMRLDTLVEWMRQESISPLALAFFTTHPDCKPGAIGSNMTGRLLIELRKQLSEVKYEVEDADALACPMCKNSAYSDGSLLATLPDEIVILAGHTNPLTFEYPSTFAIDGRCYLSVEHFVKGKLLEEFGYADLVEGWLTDLEARKPTFFKKMADFLWERRQLDETTETGNRRRPSINALRRWARTRGVECYEAALRAKFCQNPHFLRALLVTGDSLLVELRVGVTKSERAKFEVPEYCAFAPTSDFSNSGDPASFVKWVEKWGLGALVLCNLFRALRTDDGETAVSFLPNLGKNRLGMLLMELRDQFKSVATSASLQATAPSLHQFFADFLLQLLDVESGQNPKLKIRLHRVNSFIVRAADDHSAKPISVDGRCNPLSIFYLAPFTADGLCFPTLEHYRWWKFFEHHEKFLQCVPGFWDHIDGRQLRAVCEQWTNENLGLNAPILIERYRTDLEFDVLRNGALSKHSQNPHILPMLFDGVSYGPIIAGEAEGDSSFGVGMSVGKMRRAIERWQIRPETLTLWWTSLRVVKPMNVGDNLYGLALMSARDEIFAIYCERAVTNIPMAPSVKNFHEVTSEENLFFDDIDPERLFVFNEEHTTFGLNSSVTIGGKTYASVIDYLIHECFSAIGDDDLASDVDLDEAGSVLGKLSVAQELAYSKDLKASYDGWFRSAALAKALQSVAETKAKTEPEFRSELLATEKALLIGVVAEEGDGGEGSECDWSKKADLSSLTTGLMEEEFGDFLRDLRPPSTQTLQFWTRCDAASAGRLGSNLWPACLMGVRREIVASDIANGNAISSHEKCFWTLDSICEKPSNDGKNAARKRQTACVGKERSKTKPITEFQSISQGGDDRAIKEEMESEPLLVLPPMSDVVWTKDKAQEEEAEVMTALQPTIDALQRCSPLFERVVSSTETNEELKRFGEWLGEQMLSMFGGCSPDLTSFTDEDVYNLGRIAACQFSRSQ